MCGILGYGLVEANSEIVDLASWAESLSHRGPDEFGEFSEPHFGLGMRRLSIIDVENGHQPIYNESRQIVAIFNGQIYNYKNLSEMLRQKGHILNSDSDGEVIVHLYEEFGELFVDKLEGMFAIALIDLESATLLLYRDRLGKKPLVYEITENGDIFFASELKSLLQISERGPADISVESLSLYFALGYIPAPMTIFEAYSKLPPASYLKWKSGKVEVQKYWTPTISKNENSIEINKDIAKNLIESAVKKRLMSERPLGAFLSGGIDSSLVVAMLSKLSDKQIETFSVGFEHAEYDESRYAKEVSQLYKTRHTEITLRDNEIVDGFIHGFDFFDEPFADSSWLATFLLSQITAKSVTVALSGDGGDESFGGYIRYSLLRRYAKIGPLLFAIQALSHFSLIPRFFIRGKLRRVLDSTPASHSISGMYEAMMTLTGVSMRRRLFKKQFAKEAEFPHHWFRKKFELFKSSDRVMQANRYDLETYLPDDLMYKVDIASMAHSLEVRAPFLDPAVVEFGLSLPLDQRVTNVGKVLLRELAYDYLPQDLIDRPKMGFGIPRSEWLSGPLATLMESVIEDSNSLMYHWLDYSTTNQMLNDFRSGSRVDGTIWSILCLEMWARKWLKKQAC